MCNKKYNKDEIITGKRKQVMIDKNAYLRNIKNLNLKKLGAKKL